MPMSNKLDLAQPMLRGPRGRRWAAVVGVLVVLTAAGGALLRQRLATEARPQYLLINDTAVHEYDLAFRMSLKLAEKKSGIENALVLLPRLPGGKTIEETAADMFSRLRVGARTGGRGILYLYDAGDNVMKMEVSYALEGDLPDMYCRQLEEAARTYMLSEMPQDFISELIITTNLRAMGSGPATVPLSRPQWLNAEFLSGGAGSLVHGYARTLADYQRAIRALPAAQLEEFAPSEDAATTARRYLESLSRGIGDPRLPLLTEGSRIFRAVVPRDESQQKRIFEFMQAALPHRLIFAGDLALVVPQPGKSNLPVVLRHGTDGLWYVDEPKSWTYFHRFEDDVDFHVKYDDNPFLGGLRALNARHSGRALYAGRVTAAPRAPYPFDLARAVEQAEGKARSAGDAASYAALGDLYLFEINWITRAIAAYEMAEQRAPEAPAWRWRLFDLYLNASRPDKALAELKFLAERLSGDRQVRDWYAFYREQYAFR